MGGGFGTALDARPRPTSTSMRCICPAARRSHAWARRISVMTAPPASAHGPTPSPNTAAVVPADEPGPGDARPTLPRPIQSNPTARARSKGARVSDQAATALVGFARFARVGGFWTAVYASQPVGISWRRLRRQGGRDGGREKKEKEKKEKKDAMQASGFIICPGGRGGRARGGGGGGSARTRCR